MSIPSGTYIIRSAAFPNRVADLANARQADGLIGFRESRAPNQRWAFLHRGNNEYQITTTATSSAGLTAFVRAFVAEGAFVTGGGIREQNLYTVGQVGDNKFRISPRENGQLAWTLRSGVEGERLRLQDIKGNIDQAWDLIPV